MKLTVIKTLDEMRPVLKDPVSVGPDPSYWVFKEISEKWQNMTVLPPGNYGGEFTKTFGHYHINPRGNEIYRVVSGSGILVLQSEKEFKLIKLKVGDEIDVNGDYGHALINNGDEPLVTYDDRVAPHSPEDYEAVARFHGLAYYVVNNNGNVDVIPNPHYKKTPPSRWKMGYSIFHKINLLSQLRL